jgi:predicted alpha/beta-hydrolase family hydrolase
MNTPFMNSVARGLSAGGGVRVARFEFPYMRARRETGRRGGAPDREPVLRNSWKEVVERLGGGRKVVIGGKSMGGRIASMVADEVGARGLVCLGYPFHPPGRPDKLRTKHLETLATPALIVQGTRDAFGTPEDVEGYALSDAIRVVWLEDGDHSWKPRTSSGRTEALNMADGVAAIREFLEALDS